MAPSRNSIQPGSTTKPLSLLLPMHVLRFLNVSTTVTIMLMTSCLHHQPTSAYVTRIEQCEPIEIPQCQSMPYNLTQMPNWMHHNTQKNARLVFEKFEILIDQRCSEDLLFFLCSVFVPVCPVSLNSTEIPPCRKLCERVREGCEPLLHSFNVSWPDELECSNFPLYDKGLCVLPEAFVKPSKKKSKYCIIEENFGLVTFLIS